VKILGKPAHKGVVCSTGDPGHPHAGVSEFITFRMEWKEFLKLAKANK
jgi:hypothetical protein